MIPVAPRIGNEVSYVTTIKHASHFVWQAQYLVNLKWARNVVFYNRKCSW